MGMIDNIEYCMKYELCFPEHVPYEHKEIRQVHVGSFFPTKLHAPRIKHLGVDALTNSQDYILRYSLEQTITSSLSENKLSHPISVELANLSTTQAPPRDIFGPAIYLFVFC